MISANSEGDRSFCVANDQHVCARVHDDRNDCQPWLREDQQSESDMEPCCTESLDYSPPRPVVLHHSLLAQEVLGLEGLGVVFGEQARHHQPVHGDHGDLDRHPAGARPGRGAASTKDEQDEKQPHDLFGGARCPPHHGHGAFFGRDPARDQRDGLTQGEGDHPAGGAKCGGQHLRCAEPCGQRRENGDGNAQHHQRVHPGLGGHPLEIGD